jgi:uncharacterized protein (TIGR01244 family)
MFRKLTDAIYASPQIALEQVAEAAELGVTLIVNNRPEGESAGCGDRGSSAGRRDGLCCNPRDACRVQ